LECRSGEESRSKRNFHYQVNPGLLASSNEIEVMCRDPESRIFDSRSADRYRGENETIDPKAGHIPGAISAPFAENIAPDGLFKPSSELRARFTALLGGIPPVKTAFYCGSGVTAAHNLLALAHAGLGNARLYVGSWSEWITDPARSIET
jgi:thiosulfate/3-mercaptopyruvate sulfurtransferase